jgi:glycosyltransferase involved in cell wall biosynthesis
LPIDAAIFERVRSLLDTEWYSDRILLGSDERPLSHFLTIGWSKLLSPNPFFDCEWYLRVNPDVAGAKVHPFSHYIEYGEAEGRWPCRVLDPAWYAKLFSLDQGRGLVLEHFSSIGSKSGTKPNEIFDPQFYLDQNLDLPRDIRSATIHYLTHGYREDRQVSQEFSPRWYRRFYLSSDAVENTENDDPIRHFLTVGRRRGNRKNQSEIESVANDVRRFAARGPFFEDFDPKIIRQGAPKAKVVAFYLPQFHVIPENDEWWGVGFTEWNNVARGTPRFAGHHQPRIPRDLGFYDLLSPGVMERQVELAKASGIFAFCFYYYLFGKRKILEKPLERFLADRNLDMPFCLMWANENWTRRWDGRETEVLLEQRYTAEDDDFLVESVASYLQDPRYLRVGDRPLFIVYRPGQIPNMREKVAIWRNLFRERYGVEPWLMMAQTFNDYDPEVYGLDGAVEFPPHKVLDNLASVPVKTFAYDFQGFVHDYANVVSASVAFPPPKFPLIKTAFPSWDNDARRQGNGTSIINSTPAAYQNWMSALIDYSRKNKFAGESLVFVNAWNEWAEGAYLEPDVHFGAAYLNATARAVVGKRVGDTKGKMKVLLVGHDAHEHGAQMVLLNVGRAFVRKFGVEVTFLLHEGGKLISAYNELGRVFILKPGQENLGLLDDLCTEGLELALTNTVVTGSIIHRLKQLDFRVVSLVHELPRLIQEFNVEAAAGSIATQSDIAVFPAQMVCDAFINAVGPVTGKAVILPQGLYADVVNEEHSRTSVRKELGISANAKIILGVGYADLRKGIDLFLETARRAIASNPELIFVWVGRLEPSIATWLVGRDNGSGLAKNVRIVDFTDKLGRYFEAADAFYLTSREDPFPSTVLDALAFGLPVVGFVGTTGSEQLISRFGEIVPTHDTDKALNALSELISANSAELVRERKKVIAVNYRWDTYAFQLLQFLDPSLKKVSVVVPNFNYANYLNERLESIFCQNYPIFEIVILDDASTDRSMAVLDDLKRNSDRHFKVIRNAVNSNSIMSQWAKAAEGTSGDYLWIAEADDLAVPGFIQGLVAEMTDDTILAFSDSSQIDGEGDALSPSYDYYFERFHGNMFKKSFVCSGSEFALKYLTTSNIILNVSAVLFRREMLSDVLNSDLKELRSYRFAGDWAVYLHLCKHLGEITYVSQPLNIHRRHGSSATHITSKSLHVEEIQRVHRLSQELFDSGPSVLERQRAYLSEIRSQFALSGDEE